MQKIHISIQIAKLQRQTSAARKVPWPESQYIHHEDVEDQTKGYCAKSERMLGASIKNRIGRE